MSSLLSLLESSDSDEEPEILYYFWKHSCSRSLWVRDIFLDRKHLGEYHHLIPQLERDEEKFYSYFRMDKNCYNLLISKVQPLFTIGHTNFRSTITFEERFTITLKYLITGDSYHSASFRFRISHNCISLIVDQMLDLIYNALKDAYLNFPTKQQFEQIAREFYIKKKFPNCLGAIDGKHIRIHKPFNCGSLYYNYKLYHSIVLLAIVDSNYKFLMIDVGSYGKNSDGGVFEHSSFGKLFNGNRLDLPEDKPFECTDEPMPFVFVGDEAFRLSEHLMKPYPRRSLDDVKRKYNYRLSYARQLVECTFGMLVSKFRIFENSIAIYPEKVDKLIKAACVLHNFIRNEENLERLNEDTINPGSFVNLKDMSVPQNNRQRNTNQSTIRARNIRDKFATYFSGAGSVPWQDERIQTSDL